MSTTTLTSDQVMAGAARILNRGSNFDIAEYGNGQVVGGVSAGGIEAWHGLLTVSHKPLLTMDDVRELYPQIFLKVHKEPVHTAAGVPFPRKYITVREDGKPLGVVGEKYHVYDNQNVIEFGQAILDLFQGASIETAVSTKNEAAFFVVLRIPRDIRIAGMEDERHDLYLLVSNSQDASSKFRAIITLVRAVCTNSENYAIKTAPRKYELRHTASLEGRALEAREVLGITWNYTETFEAIGNRLVEAKLRASDFTAFLNKLVPMPSGMTEGRAFTVRTGMRDDIRSLYMSSPNLENVRGTRWAALQAVSEYHDHLALRRSTAVASAAENRFEAIIEAPEDNLPNRALALLT